MNTNAKMRCVWGLIFIFASCLVVTNANATSTHAFIWSKDTGMVDIGTLGGVFSQAYAINDLGQVVGMSTTSSGEFHAFLWTQNAGMVDIGTLGGTSYAMGINDSGQVVGASMTGSGVQHPFLWSASSGMQDLSAPNDPWGFAEAINNRGEVVGTVGLNASYWSPNGQLVNLGALGGRYAVDINNSGQVVGLAYTTGAIDLASAINGCDGGVCRGYVWSEEKGMTLIGTLGGDYSRAEGINDLGQVIGRSHTTITNQSNTAFIWTEANGISGLGLFGGEIQDINNAGWIVGGFLWTPDSGYVDLGTLGGHFTCAYGTNNLGQVVGWSEAVPEPATMLLLGSGMLGLFGLRKKFKK